MKLFTLSMLFGLAVAGAASAQGSPLMSGYAKINAVSAPAKAPQATAAVKAPVRVTRIDNKQPVYIYKAPMATRPLKTW